jgi:hypothetical protein
MSTSPKAVQSVTFHPSCCETKVHRVLCTERMGQSVESGTDSPGYPLGFSTDCHSFSTQYTMDFSLTAAGMKSDTLYSFRAC